MLYVYKIATDVNVARKPSLEVAPATSATFLSDRKIARLLSLIFNFRFRIPYCLFLVRATSRSVISVVQQLSLQVTVNFDL